ncbi:MAG: proline--tRNA ligase [Nitrososphaeria archaeon]
MVLLQPEKAFPDKEKNFSEWYSLILERAELVDIRYNVKGFVVYRPNLMRLINLIRDELERGLTETGHQPVLFPLVIPMSYLRKEEEHITGFEAEVFKIRGEEGEEDLALRPTSETAFYPMYSLWIHSYRDLPLKLFQTVTVYRKETKATRPLIRGREFLWIEAHDAFSSEDDALRQVSEDIRITRNALEKFGLAFIVVEREEWDKFPGAEKTFAFDCIMPEGRVLQIATTHYLGTKFSIPFEIIFLDKDGSKKYVHQTCFGPGLSRMAAAVISTHGDEYGLVLPFEVAPIQVVVVPIPKEGLENRILEKCFEVEERLKRLNLRVKVDDSEDRPGSKFYKWELYGVPVRVEVGAKEVVEKKLTLFRRDLRKRWAIEDSFLEQEIMYVKDDISRVLRSRAYERLEGALVRINCREEGIEASRNGKIILMNFCGQKECYEKIKEDTGGYEVRGRRVDVEEKVWGPCAWCGRPAEKVVVVAKSF